jgi:hypothetical protein
MSGSRWQLCSQSYMNVSFSHLKGGNYIFLPAAPGRDRILKPLATTSKIGIYSQGFLFSLLLRSNSSGPNRLPYRWIPKPCVLGRKVKCVWPWNWQLTFMSGRCTEPTWMHSLSLHLLFVVSICSFETGTALPMKNAVFWNIAVRISQETHYISPTEPSRLMLCKIWGLDGCDCEECRLLGC